MPSMNQISPKEPVDLSIYGMTCAACVRRVETALAAVPGVGSASVNLANRRARVSGDAPVDALLEAVDAVGYRAAPAPKDLAAEAAEDRAQAAEFRGELIKLTAAALLTLPLILQMGAELLGLSWMLPGWVQALLAAPVQFWAGARFYKAAWRAARSGHGNMDLLVVLGTSAAFFFSLYQLLLGMPHLYFEAAVVVTLVLLGRVLEARARRSAVAAIRALMKLRPETARIERGGQAIEMPAEALRIGDIPIVKPGERFPCDGEVLEGESEADESLLTGESLPVAKKPGARVIGGALNGDGLLRIRASSAVHEGVLARIIALVENAQASKAPIEKLVDRVSAVFVPVVLGLAILTFIGWWAGSGDWQAALIPAVSILVVACPCALGLATPTAIIVGTGIGARRGILLRDASALERAREISVVVFDKTGTLTEGHLEVTTLEGEDPARLLFLAASAQQGSEHPIARALLERAAGDGLALKPPAGFKRLGGRGLTASVAGEDVAIGNARLMAELGVDVARYEASVAKITSEAASAIFVAAGRPLQLLGVVGLGDQLRQSAIEAVAELKARGIETVMLTGDSKAAAEAVAAKLGIARVLAEVLPEGKVAEIERLKAEGRVVAMVGDGVNDAPALAAADVGMAMGGGSDAAMATAPVTLMRGDPRLVAEAIELSRRTSRKIRENLFWAFIYNLVMLPLAASGDLSPMLAGAAMALSSVSVVGNSLLLRVWGGGRRGRSA
ncbi:MAG TPA: heavy metal translocating P-type ATPase [Dongiaceae bacterium]